MDEFDLPAGDDVTGETLDGFAPAAPAEPMGLDALDAMGAPEESSGVLDAFNAEWAVTLSKKADEEMEMKSKMLAEAKVELENWNKQQEIRVTTKKETNRTEEKRQVEQTEAAADPSKNPWERVISLVDPNVDGSASKDTDTSRMHKLFIQLKNEPIKA